MLKKSIAKDISSSVPDECLNLIEGGISGKEKLIFSKLNVDAKVAGVLENDIDAENEMKGRKTKEKIY